MNQIKIMKELPPTETNNGNIDNNNNFTNQKILGEIRSKNQEVAINKENESSNLEKISSPNFDNKNLNNKLTKPHEKGITSEKNSEIIQNDIKNKIENKTQLHFTKNKDSEFIENKEFNNSSARKNDGKGTDIEDSSDKITSQKDLIPGRLKINENFLPTTTPPSNLSEEYFASLFNENSSIENKKEIIMKYYIIRPIPLSAGNLLFTIKRINQTFHGTKFELYSSEKLHFLLKSKRANSNIQHDYIISMDQVNLTKSSR